MGIDKKAGVDIMSTQYPNQIDLFELKHNATSQDDPSGDYVMAEDVNDLQDSITAIETVLGKNPQGEDATVGDRVTKLESSILLRVSPILIYLGSPEVINGSTTVDEAVGHYLKYDQVVLGADAQDPLSIHNTFVSSIITKVNASRSVKFYGYIDISNVNDAISDIQVKINQWLNLGVAGIFCDHFGYADGVSRERQNLVLDSIHQYSMPAIISASNPDEVLSDLGDTTYNPGWVAPNILPGDIYYYEQFAVDALGYTSSTTLFGNMDKLYSYKDTLGIKIFATSLIPTSINDTDAQTYFDYAHAVAILCSLDGFYAVDQNSGSVSDAARFYQWTPISGQWQVKIPDIIHSVDGYTHTRETGFGKIIVHSDTHTFEYIGTSIPSYFLRLLPDSLDGNAFIDGSIPGDKVDYDGSLVISAINASSDTIDLDNITGLLDGGGDITQGLLEANVINAINANIGVAVIQSAKISDLDTSKITTGTLSADRISASVVAAINLYAATIQAGDARIDNAVIGTLSVDNLSTSVISAINASIESATIDSAKIADLSADKITAGDIAADRMRANVVSAINVYAESIITEDAKIVTAAIGELTADRIQGTVVDAINLYAGAAVIDAAKIGSLTADNIKANIIEAINASIESVTIDSAKIGALSVDNMTANVVSAINLNSQGADITDLNADNITSGNIAANLLTANVISAINASVDFLSGGRIDARSIDANSIKAGSITSTEIAAGSITGDVIDAGSITSDHIATGGLDAQIINVYDSNTGQVLIGGGFIRVDSFDAGVVQSDNLARNGSFITSSSSFGFLRRNPQGEMILGAQSSTPGANQVWVIDTATGSVLNTIDIPGKKPRAIAFDLNETYAYVTVEGNNTIVQVDLANHALTPNSLTANSQPGIIKFVGAITEDDKHMFVLGTDTTSDSHIPDSLMVIDAPPTSVNEALYLHHVIPLGNNPYDFVMDNDEYVYITMASQGDILVTLHSNFNSMTWHVIDRIPISAYDTDNYHGGLPGEVGLNLVTGGSASQQYETDQSQIGIGTQTPNGYGDAQSTMTQYTPQGIALSSDATQSHLYVADAANDMLVIVDKKGHAPYNGLTGTREQGNVGAMGFPWGGPPQISGSRNYVAMSEGKMTTDYARYRIPIGDTPNFVVNHNGKIFVSLTGSAKVAVITEQDILDEIDADNAYYGTFISNGEFTNWSVFAPHRALPTFSVRYIDIGSKPKDMTVDPTNNKLYVTVNGQNQVAVIDIATETIDRMINVGQNPLGLAVTADGTKLYVANNGGTELLTFNFGDGPYFGDPYLGLECLIDHQGGMGWTPDRSDWVYNGNLVQSSSVVEFHINEPFLEEGGYAKIALQGPDPMLGKIEQDIIGVVNYSDGNNTENTTGEKLKAVGIDNTVFTPRNIWMDSPIPTFKVVSLDSNKDRVEVIPSPATYTVSYGDGSQIEFDSNTIVPDGGWVEADYTYHLNVWFKYHTASIMVDISDDATPGFITDFEVDEFVPKFLKYDNSMTSSFTPTADGITDTYEGLQYSMMTNRALSLDIANISTNGTTIAGTLDLLVDGDKATGTNYFGSSTANTYVQLDLGTTYMIGKIIVWHQYDDGRTYHNTKTEVSQDGTTWTTVFDSAVDGEYVETSTGHIITFDAIPVRYIRDTANGSTIDTDSHWKEIEVYADWECIYNVTYVAPSPKDGQQVASNGNYFVQTDIEKAFVSLDIPIEFTTFSWLTFVAGPSYGVIQVEMPTLLNATHYINQSWEYVTNRYHRIKYAYPPSVNIQANTSKNIQTGKHRLILKQREGTVTLDTLRIEDYQYYNGYSSPISTNSGDYKRFHTTPKLAIQYQGQGLQSTDGPYNIVRKNKGLPDNSVSLKYRIRLICQTIPSGGISERGTAFVTSAIFEKGKQYSHYRFSQGYDVWPAVKIEKWDPIQPHKTGIQSDQLADGSVRGNKLMPNSVMAHHISPYARIQEFKLWLNYPTHYHGQASISPQTGALVVTDNKAILDQITGWGTSGTSTDLARADHDHDDRYLLASGGVISSDLTIQGNLLITGNVDGVDVSLLKSDFDTHIADNVIHLNSTEHTKLTGISDDANNVTYISNGVLSFDGINTTVYEHPTTSGNIHLPSGGAIGNFLKWASDGTGSWANISWSDILSKPSSATADIDDAVSKRHSQNTDTATTSTSFNIGSGTALTNTMTLSFGTGSAKPIIRWAGSASNTFEFYYDGTNQATLFAATYKKTDGTEVSYEGHTHLWVDITDKPSTFTPPIATGSILGGVKIGTGLTINGSGLLTWTHPTGDGNLHVPATSTTHNNMVLKAGPTAGSLSWGSVAWGEITSKPTTFTPSAHTHTVSNITDIATYYAALASANTLTDTLTLTKTGLALKLQPSSVNTSGVIVMQVVNNVGSNTFTIDDAGNVVINGDLQVSGTQTNSGTQNIDGDYTVSGNLDVGGNATLGDAITDQTTVAGDLKVNGVLKNVGVLSQVISFPVFGPGDLPIEVNDTVANDITDDYGTFLTGADRIPDTPTGADRWYRLLVRYSDSDAATTSTMTIVQQGTTTSAVTLTNSTDLDLPGVGGGVGGPARTWISQPFQSSFTGDTTFQVKRNASGSSIQIKYIQVTVYDKYTS